jgi:prophage antirepressor-like protein
MYPLLLNIKKNKTNTYLKITMYKYKMELIKQIDETVSFNEKNIRLIGTYQEPWFVAKDICDILELKNITEAMKIIPEKWRGSEKLNTFGGEQNMIIINEAGLYKLIMRSNKPIAQKFQEVVCEEILPSIRKKGEFKLQELIDKNKNLEDKFVELSEKHFKLEENHKRILYKKKRHTLKKGPCLYLLRNPGIENKIKVGISKNLNSRISTYVTYFEPDFVFIIFTNSNKLLEQCVKEKFKQNISESGDEWLIEVDKNEIISYIEFQSKLLNLDFTSHKNIEEIKEKDDVEIKDDNEEDDNEEDDNEEDDNEEDDEEDEEHVQIEVEALLKTCSKCLLEQNIDLFNKDRTKKDGYRGICRKCEKLNKEEYKKRKEEEFVPLTEKKCISCKEVKDIIKFSRHMYSKDGYVHNCLDCAKKTTNQARITDKETGIRYKCSNCSKDYSRKDTLTKHLKICKTQ